MPKLPVFRNMWTSTTDRLVFAELLVHYPKYSHEIIVIDPKAGAHWPVKC